MMLFRYIFYLSYKFFVKVFQEKEFPHYLAAGVISFICLTTFLIIGEILQLIFTSIDLSDYQGWYKYAILILWGLVSLFVTYKQRYLQIIIKCEQLSRRYRNILKLTSIFYILLILFMFFGFQTIF